MAKTIKINDKLWNDATTEERESVIDLMLEEGLINEGDVFEPDASAQDMSDAEIEELIAADTSKTMASPCRIACIAAYHAITRRRDCKRKPWCKPAAKVALAACLGGCPG